LLQPFTALSPPTNLLGLALQIPSIFIALAGQNLSDDRCSEGAGHPDYSDDERHPHRC
jgi:hypothetical protein